jgi:hypothetical protein
MMAGSTVMQQSRVLGGAQLPQQRQSAARPAARNSTVRTVAMAKRKVNTFDEAWKKGFWGSGYFNEDSERAPPNLLKAVENKKLLSTAGKLKLLSRADSAGLNLAKLEQLKLLSTAEKLGLFSLAERVLTTDPGAISSASIPFFLAAVGSLVFIPQDTLLQSVAHWTAFAACFTGFATLFIGGFVVAAVQEE